LSPDFGESWDIPAREFSASNAYTFYSKGFDAAQFRSNQDISIYYGTAVDLLIKIAQHGTTDALQRLKIRIFLQALISLSCLIPVFLISARVLPKPLALISVALLAATPIFLGHAFINPKDSIFASGLLWGVYLILHCFDGEGKPSYRQIIGLAALLALVVSIRFTGAYLLLLIPISAIVLPSLRLHESKPFTSLPARLWRQVALQNRRLALLFVTFVLAYALLMPGILSNFRMEALVAAFGKFVHIPFPRWRTVLYFGQDISPQQLPWHYIYGYMLVQLPLYYHLFVLTIILGVVSRRTMLRPFDDFWRSDKRAPTVILLAAALAIPLLWILLVRPALYDTLRHVLFLVPLISMLLYFGFVEALRGFGNGLRWTLILLATAGYVEAMLAMRSLHPYEYVYYNPLVNPTGAFELDYWGTSFREVAERLNDYARENGSTGEKLRLYVCGPLHTLTPFLDADKFEIVRKDAAPQFTVALNRCLQSTGPNHETRMAFLDKPWVISIGRGNLIFAAVARNDSGPP
jgi:hypothetical protein